MQTEQELIDRFTTTIENLLDNNNKTILNMKSIAERSIDPELQHNARVIINALYQAFNFQSKAGEIIRLTQAKRFDLLTSKK